MFYAYDIQRSPFLRITIPFIIGILAFIFFPLEFSLLMTAVFIILILSLIGFKLILKFRKKHYNPLIYGLLLVFSLTYSGYYYSAVYNINMEKDPVSETGNMIMGEIEKAPQEKEKSVKLIIRVDAIQTNGKWIASDGKAILYLEKSKKTSDIETGDRILFEPQLQEVSNPGNPHEFDYKKYLSYNLISQQAYLKSGQWKLLKSDSNYNLLKWSDRTRKSVIQLFRDAGLKDDELSVVSALALGYSDDLDTEIKQAYSSSGAMHILAVSGLHVAVVYMVFSYMLFFMDRKKWTKILKGAIIILLLWAYAVLTGLSPSVLRAAIMFSFVVGGQMLGKYTNIYNSLAASALLLLLLNPFNITNIGFQFSYLAVVGIVFFNPVFYNMLYVKNKWLDKVWSLVTVSISAQLIIGPLSVYYFNQFPNYFLITNIIAIPISTVLIYEVVLLMLVSWIPFMEHFTGKVISITTELLNNSVIWVEKLPGSVSNGIPLSLNEALVLYVLIFSFTFYLISGKAKPLMLSLASVVSFLVLLSLSELRSEDRKEIYVYNINKYSAINLIDGKNNMLFTNLYSTDNQYKFAMKNNWLSLGLEEEKTIPLNKLNNQFLLSNLFYLNNPNVFYKDQFFSFYDKRFSIVTTELPRRDSIQNKVNLDFVILASNAKVKIKDVLKVYNTKQIIVDSSNSAYKTKKWKEEAAKLGIELYIIKEKGAFFVDLSV